MFGAEVERINLNSEAERKEVNDFLMGFDLILDKDVDYTLVMRENDVIKATCSKARNVLKCFAISDDWRGEGVTGTLITALVDKLFEQGIYHCFIFTKPDKVQIFSSLGFKLIHQAKDVALLESGMTDINRYLSNLKAKYNLGDEEKAAIVMNCNPFTLGHKYLIEEAAAKGNHVIIFMVEEDRSLFPFKVRYELVKKGVSHLKNVTVIPGGEYIISSATFPSYFLREESTKLKAYTELDAAIFGKYFCKTLNIKRRYVGSEPYCKVTNAYNETLDETLNQYGVELKLIERKSFKGEEISASRVRNLIKSSNIEELKDIVPEVTYEFLKTDLGKEIVENIKHSNSPH